MARAASRGGHRVGSARRHRCRERHRHNLIKGDPPAKRCSAGGTPMDHKDLEIPMYSHILIPTDGSSLSTAALEKGLSFARDARAKATILTITEPLHLFPGRGDQLEHMCADYARNSKEHAVRCLAEAEAKAKALHVPC